MAKQIEELQQEVSGLRALLAQAGIIARPAPTARGTDYVPHGSPQHAAMIGLCEVGDAEQAARDGYTVYTSPTTGKCWRLEDEIGTVHYYPGVDPQKAILLVLRQKVNVIEAGAPTVPPNAPPMFTGDEEVRYA